MTDDKAPRLLIIDDEKAICDVLRASLVDEGYNVESAADGEFGLAALESFRPHIVLLDIWMPGIDGLEVLKRAKERSSLAQFIIMSGHGTIETAVKAVKLGAWDFVEKPLSMDKILILAKNILNFQNEQREKQLLLNKLRTNLALIGSGESMKALKSTIAAAANQALPVLIVGEAGAGKTLVAHNIHYLSNRAGKNFVEVQCGKMAPDLQMQEIFGAERGVNPAGSEGVRKGKLELAKGGTLYLDEVTELSLPAQARLLEFIKTGHMRREGSERHSPLSATVIAATEANVVELVRSQKFLNELYHRLGTVTIRVPSLRDRLEDVPDLLVHFGQQIIFSDGGHELKNFTEAALAALKAYPWPGNVREFRNFVERLYILIADAVLDVEDLRFAGLVQKAGGVESQIMTFREARAEFEKDFLLKKIAENQGNISRTAEVIGLERSYLHRKIKAYGIEP